jgi:hypothetical protein
VVVVDDVVVVDVVVVDVVVVDVWRVVDVVVVDVWRVVDVVVVDVWRVVDVWWWGVSVATAMKSPFEAAAAVLSTVGMAASAGWAEAL